MTLTEQNLDDICPLFWLNNSTYNLQGDMSFKNAHYVYMKDIIIC